MTGTADDGDQHPPAGGSPQRERGGRDGEVASDRSGHRDGDVANEHQSDRSDHHTVADRPVTHPAVVHPTARSVERNSVVSLPDRATPHTVGGQRSEANRGRGRRRTGAARTLQPEEVEALRRDGIQLRDRGERQGKHLPAVPLPEHVKDNERQTAPISAEQATKADARPGQITIMTPKKAQSVTQKPKASPSVHTEGNEDDQAEDLAREVKPHDSASNVSRGKPRKLAGHLRLPAQAMTGDQNVDAWLKRQQYPDGEQPEQECVTGYQPPADPVQADLNYEDQLEQEELEKIEALTQERAEQIEIQMVAKRAAQREMAEQKRQVKERAAERKKAASEAASRVSQQAHGSRSETVISYTKTEIERLLMESNEKTLQSMDARVRRQMADIQHEQARELAAMRASQAREREQVERSQRELERRDREREKQLSDLQAKQAQEPEQPIGPTGEPRVTVDQRDRTEASQAHQALPGMRRKPSENPDPLARKLPRKETIHRFTEPHPPKPKSVRSKSVPNRPEPPAARDPEEYLDAYSQTQLSDASSQSGATGSYATAAQRSQAKGSRVGSTTHMSQNGDDLRSEVQAPVETRAKVIEALAKANPHLLDRLDQDHITTVITGQPMLSAPASEMGSMVGSMAREKMSPSPIPPVEEQVSIVPDIVELTHPLRWKSQKWPK